MSWWPSYTGPWSRCTPRRLHSWGTCYSRPASSHVAAPLEQEKEMKWKINWNHFLVNKKLFQLSTWHWFPLYRICKEKYFSFQGSELRLGHSKKSIFQTASLASNLLLLLALHLMHLCGWKIGSVKKKTESYHQRIKSSTLHFIFRYLLYQFWVLPLKQNQMRQHLYRSEVDLSVCQSIGLRILNNILKGFNVVVLSHNISCIIWIFEPRFEWPFGLFSLNIIIRYLHLRTAWRSLCCWWGLCTPGRGPGPAAPCLCPGRWCRPPRPCRASRCVPRTRSTSVPPLRPQWPAVTSRGGCWTACNTTQPLVFTLWVS